jgi:hypothetical protein
VGTDLTHYYVDVAAAELTKRETVTLPAAVQYAWPHASRRYLYVASSSSVLQRRPWCCARIDMEEGELHVDFDGREVTYGFGELILAHATSMGLCRPSVKWP